jgi:radical SAM superfamily enzyme YgiQ (UPF0313 family)
VVNLNDDRNGRSSASPLKMNARRNHLLLIQTPYYEDYGPMRKAAGTYFPLGLGYISSFVKQYGYDVSFMDMNVQDTSHKDIAKFVCQEKPTLVGISFMTPQFYAAKNIADVVKEAAPEVSVVLGGAHPSVMPRRSLEEIPSADFVVFGEGEITTLGLLEFLSKRRGALAGISGLAWRKNDAIMLNSPRPLLNDLDALPFPDRDLIDQSLYRHQSFLSYYKHVQTIYTSRGCPGRCVYCASGYKLRCRVRVRSVDRIMDEISLLRDRYNMDYLLIKDDSFTLNKRRIKEFCAALMKRHAGLRWHCMCRVDTVNYDVLSIMKDAGLNDVFFGIESGNDQILKNAGKGVTTADNRKAVEAADSLGIRTYGAFILGLPGDTAETIQQTIEFACSLPLTMAGFSILIPYPGTKVFEDYYPFDESNSLDYHAFIASTGVHYVREYTGLNGIEVEQLPAYITKAQKSFYMRPSQILRMLKESSPDMLLGYARGFAALFTKALYLRQHKKAA